jgi:hypothetical protein
MWQISDETFGETVDRGAGRVAHGLAGPITETTRPYPVPADAPGDSGSGAAAVQDAVQEVGRV